MITITPLTSIHAVEMAASVTSGKDVTITPEKWVDWLHSEHSPIRAYIVAITMTDIPYYCSVHFARHKIGVEHYVKSQRVYESRAEMPQGALVTHMMIANAQAVLNISRKRLCRKADKTTSYIWHDVRYAFLGHEDCYVKEIGKEMQAECEYRGGICHEMKSCGYCKKWSEQ